MHFDIPLQSRVRPSRGMRAAGRPTGRADLDAPESTNVFHWAAVALVTALMCAVLACAAGTPALSKAATITSFVFGIVGASLVAGGVLNAVRTRLTRRNAALQGAAS